MPHFLLFMIGIFFTQTTNAYSKLPIDTEALQRYNLDVLDSYESISLYELLSSDRFGEQFVFKNQPTYCRFEDDLLVEISSLGEGSRHHSRTVSIDHTAVFIEVLDINYGKMRETIALEFYGGNRSEIKAITAKWATSDYEHFEYGTAESDTITGSFYISDSTGMMMADIELLGKKLKGECEPGLALEMMMLLNLEEAETLSSFTDDDMAFVLMRRLNKDYTSESFDYRAMIAYKAVQLLAEYPGKFKLQDLHQAAKQLEYPLKVLKNEIFIENTNRSYRFLLTSKYKSEIDNIRYSEDSYEVKMSCEASGQEYKKIPSWQSPDEVTTFCEYYRFVNALYDKLN